jgi:hypothetical protein
MRKLTTEDKRVCYVCNSNQTYMKNGIHPMWFTNKPTDLFICAKCHKKYFWTRKIPQIKTKEAIKLTNQKAIFYKQKHKRLPSNPRKGICSNCNKQIGDEYINSKGEVARIKYTNIHHLEYDDNNLLKDTVELCASCHGKETIQKRIESGWIPYTR